MPENQTLTPPSTTPSIEPSLEQPTKVTRTSVFWITVVSFFIVVLLLVIFIAQNAEKVKVSFLGFHGHPPLAVAMLLSAVAGALLVSLAGGMRILQLRRAATRNAHANRG